MRLQSIETGCQQIEALAQEPGFGYVATGRVAVG
jgi:hypothetical protein